MKIDDPRLKDKLHHSDDPANYLNTIYAYHAHYFFSEIRPEDKFKNLTALDVVAVNQKGELTVLDGRGYDLFWAAWHYGQRKPSVIHGLEGVSDYDRVIVSNKQMALTVWLFGEIAADHIYYLTDDRLEWFLSHTSKYANDYFSDDGDINSDLAAELEHASWNDWQAQLQDLKELEIELDADIEQKLSLFDDDDYDDDEEYYDEDEDDDEGDFDYFVASDVKDLLSDSEDPDEPADLSGSAEPVDLTNPTGPAGPVDAVDPVDLTDSSEP